MHYLLNAPVIVLLIGMWRALTSILGISEETDGDTDEDEAQEVLLSECPASASAEQREFIGTVTSLHSAYGLIDHEICFTMEVVSGSMPKVGDRVHVVSSRKNAVGGWRAKRVWMASDNDFFNETETTAASPSRPVCVTGNRDDLMASKHDRREFVDNVDGISVTESIDFGSMQLGESSSLTIIVR